MQINLPLEDIILPMLCDLPAGAEFAQNCALYIKHDPSGSGYRCYNLNSKRWVTIGKCTSVRPVSITCTAEFI